MNFAGWVKCSLIDFPKKISTILFTQGCSFRCPFCHNPSLVLPHEFSKNLIQEEEVLSFLQERKGKLDGLVVTGGEPTIHEGLVPFLKKVKALGFSIKLDTNGHFPKKVFSILQEGIVDYWAMDIKAPLDQYEQGAGVPVNKNDIQESISLIMHSQVPYEFRTTLLRELHNEEAIKMMAKEVQGAMLYVLQKFRPEKTLDPSFGNSIPFSDQEMNRFCDVAKPYVGAALVR